MIRSSPDVRVRAQVALCCGDLTSRQRTVMADVLLYVDILVTKAPDDRASQDAALGLLREAWTRLDDAMGDTR